MRIRKVKSEIMDAKPKKGWSVALTHPGYSIEPCPNCKYPEADGGYCPECGWTHCWNGQCLGNYIPTLAGQEVAA